MKVVTMKGFAIYKCSEKQVGKFSVRTVKRLNDGQV